MTQVLVTGANGFVGKALCSTLTAAGWQVRKAVRRPGLSTSDSPNTTVEIGEIGTDTDWSEALDGIEIVIHLAARVHVMTETADDPLTEFRRVNTIGTEHLARMAANCGVKRFVFLSTIKVNGESTVAPFTEKDPPHPEDAYAVSKWEAEQHLLQVSQEKGLDVIIIRSPLVYGPEVKGNFLRILRWVDSGIPLPLGKVENSRSLVFLDNLVDLLRHSLEHPAAVNKTFLVADDVAMSVPELIRQIAGAMGKKCRLVPVPLSFLQLGALLLGCSRHLSRLSDSLQVDNRFVKKCLDWTPPVSTQEGLLKTVQWYRDSKRQC